MKSLRLAVPAVSSRDVPVIITSPAKHQDFVHYMNEGMIYSFFPDAWRAGSEGTDQPGRMARMLTRATSVASDQGSRFRRNRPARTHGEQVPKEPTSPDAMASRFRRNRPARTHGEQVPKEPTSPDAWAGCLPRMPPGQRAKRATRASSEHSERPGHCTIGS